MPSEAKKHPNIVFILTDNQPAAVLPTYGNPDVRSPNIDKLAAEGVRFDNAFAVNGLCSPTRATLHTGLLPSQHGVHDFIDDQSMESLPEGWGAVQEFRTLPQTLGHRGYRTALIGKWHLGRPEAAGAIYDEWIALEVGHTIDFWDNKIVSHEGSYEVDEEHIVDHFAKRSAQWIEGHDADKPFFLVVSFDGPYMNPPSNLGPARNRHYHSYEGRPMLSFPREGIHESVLQQLIRPDPGLDYRNQLEFAMHTLWDTVRQNADPESIANAASQNTMIDDGVGTVLAALEKKGLTEDTIVILSSDQGNFFGHYGLWGHVTMTHPASPYVVAMRVPLLIRAPGRTPPGSTSDLMIGQYDMMPTILDLAGFGDLLIAGSPGRSFVGAFDDGWVEGWGETVFFDQIDTRVAQTPEWAYWKRLDGFGKHALFDMKTDPEQRLNVYGRPGTEQVTTDLDKRLTKFFDEHVDPEWDLWTGGTVKAAMPRSPFYRAKWGPDWDISSEVKPPFKGPGP